MKKRVTSKLKKIGNSYSVRLPMWKVIAEAWKENDEMDITSIKRVDSFANDKSRSSGSSRNTRTLKNQKKK